MTISPVKDAQGRVIGASKVARDITERKRLAVLLQEAELSGRLLQLQMKSEDGLHGNCMTARDSCLPR